MYCEGIGRPWRAVWFAVALAIAFGTVNAADEKEFALTIATGVDTNPFELATGETSAAFAQVGLAGRVRTNANRHLALVLL